MPEPELKRLQRWMSHVIQHPADSETASHEEAARELIPRGTVVGGDVVRPSATMTPLRRMDVYNGGYLSRLIEVLESDFDGIKYALGDDAWFELAKSYVVTHPSRHPNLNQFGAELSAWIAQRPDLPHREFLTDLARLQWTVVQTFDAPEFEPLDVAPLSSLTQEQWAGVVFEPNPSVHLLRFDYPANGFLQQFFDDKEPSIPEPHPTWLVVYRKDDRVWRVRLPEPIHAILTALVAGVPFATALEAGGEHGEDVSHWFQEWSADGLFVAARVP